MDATSNEMFAVHVAAFIEKMLNRGMLVQFVLMATPLQEKSEQVVMTVHHLSSGRLVYLDSQDSIDDIVEGFDPEEFEDNLKKVSKEWASSMADLEASSQEVSASSEVQPVQQ